MIDAGSERILAITPARGTLRTRVMFPKRHQALNQLIE
jgi:hypothetical protein